MLITVRYDQFWQLKQLKHQKSKNQNRYTDSDYPFSSFKLFFYACYRQWTEIPNVNTEFHNWILNKLLMDV
jgi:hypothetical protein